MLLLILNGKTLKISFEGFMFNVQDSIIRDVQQWRRRACHWWSCYIKVQACRMSRDYRGLGLSRSPEVGHWKFFIWSWGPIYFWPKKFSVSWMLVIIPVASLLEASVTRSGDRPSQRQQWRQVRQHRCTFFLKTSDKSFC